MAPTGLNPVIQELTRQFDHILEEHGFGNDHWHSLLWNLHNVHPEEWTSVPAGGNRTIRELVVHIGSSFVKYDDSIFSSNERRWDDTVIDGSEPGVTPDQTVAWLRLAHARLRSHLQTLSDDDLTLLRPAPWGDQYETRRLIEILLQHTLYHTGEINHIRALLQGNDAWGLDDLGRE